MSVLDWIKEHPWETGTAIFAVGAVSIFVLNSGGGSTASSGGLSDTQIAAQTQLAAQQNAIQAQAASQNLSAALQTAQLQAQLQATEDQYNLQYHQIDVSSNMNANNNQTAVDLANVQMQGSVATTSLITAAQVATAQSAANANVAIAQANAELQSKIAMYQEQGVAAQANALVGQAKALAQGSGNTIGGIIGSLGNLAAKLF